MAFGNVYRKITNVLLSLLMIVGLFTVSAAVDSSKYEVKAEGTSATLTTGQNFNVAIKTLAGNTSPTYSTSNSTITAFERSNEAPASGVTTADISENQDGSVVAWFDSGTIYWYSDADTVYMNEDSSKMFYYCTKLTSLDVSSFDTSNVTNMSGMFGGCSGLTSLDVRNFNTSNVTNMSSMFRDCSGLTSLDVSSFDTSKVTNMYSMFAYCSGLTSLDLSSFDTSNVTDMSAMFYYCNGLTSLDVSGFDTSNVTNMGYMFYNCKGLTTLNVSGEFDTSNVTNMFGMFYGCSGLTSLDLRNFDTSNVTNMAFMFYGCSGFTTLDLSSFDTSNVTNMAFMFYGCNNLATIYASDMWNTDKATGSSNMFSLDTNLVGELGTAYDASHTDIEYARIDDYGTPGYLTYKLPDVNPQQEGQSWAIVNEPYHSFNLLKTSSYDGTAVQGAVFNLSGESDYGSVVDMDVTSEASGLVKFTNLEPGTYLLVETQAPEHFVRDETERFVTVRKDGTVEITGLTQDGTSFPIVNERLEDDQVVITKKWQDGLTGTDAANRPAPNIIVSTRKSELGYRITYDANGGFFGSDTSATTNTVTYNFFPAETGYDAVVASGEVLTPTAPTDGFILEGWYTDQACTTPLDLTAVPASKDTTVYAKYEEDTRVFLTTGQNFNQAIKQLAGDSSATYETEDTAITAFERSATAPASGVTTADISKNQNGSVVAWFDNGTIYWYSNANTVYLNEDSSCMFAWCEGLTSLDVTGFDTSNVTNMSAMFISCSGLTSLDVSSFDTSNVTDMSEMFYYCAGITDLDVSNFDTSNVTNMSWMFSECYSLTSIDVSGEFDTSNVTDMSSMFYECTGLTSLDISNFNTAKVTNMYEMFIWCSGLTSLDLNNFDTSNVTDMSEMFSGCSGLTSLDLSNFNTSNVTYMSEMFANCYSLTTLDVSGFDTSNVTNMYYMFAYCSRLRTIYAGTNWNTDKVTSSSYMFYDCTNLIGGAGTVYRSSKVGKTYAHIDGGTSNPGYLTAKS